MRTKLSLLFPLLLLLPGLALAQDADGDGSPASVDCDDADPANFPGNSEICDGQDNDCNGVADFGLPVGGDVWVQSGGGAINNTEYTKGNAFVASADTTVTAFGMTLDAPAGETLTLIIAESTSGTGGPYTILAQPALTAASTGKQVHTATGLNVPIVSGRSYFFGATWNLDVVNYYNGSVPLPTWASSATGAHAPATNGTPPSGTWSPQGTPSGLYDMEITTAAPGETWAQTGGSAISNGSYTKGTMVTVSADTTVARFGMTLDAASGTPLTLSILESTSGNNGPFTVVSQTSMTSAAGGKMLHEVTGLSVPLTSGNTYFFGATWDGNATNYFSGPVALPTWASAVAGAYSNTQAVVPSNGWTPSTVLNGSPYDVEVETGSGGGISEQVDDDSDGSPACADCDDLDPANYPGATELCDGFDNDCDGLLWADEVDGDGDGLAVCDGDCDDTDPTAYPGNAEVCDTVDNDCDGVVPSDELDADGDGVAVCAGDCDDAQPAAYPGNTEVCDGIDNDCDGVVPGTEIDGDGDGVYVCGSPADCDDTNASVYPGAGESCDGLDTDCDGSIPAGEADVDGDGWIVCAGDCADGDASVYPGAAEGCDGLDTDCDGTLPADEADADADGWLPCEGDCDDSAAAVNPDATEDCSNGVDDDCDGLADGDDADCAGDDDDSVGDDDDSVGDDDDSVGDDDDSVGDDDDSAGDDDDATLGDDDDDDDDGNDGTLGCAGCSTEGRSGSGGLGLLLLGLGLVARRRRD